MDKCNVTVVVVFTVVVAVIGTILIKTPQRAVP